MRDDEDDNMMVPRIDRIVVQDFKSYKGRQIIGPFKSFTAVIGPNGSGKSNLMDAISFVLGVRTQQLRGSLKELLYAPAAADAAAGPSADQTRPRRGFVQLVYVTADGGEVTFARVIQPSGSDADAAYQSVYKIDDRTVTWDAYVQRLGTYGILVKARNFLVFQVRVLFVCVVGGGVCLCWFGGGRGRCFMRSQIGRSCKNRAAPHNNNEKQPHHQTGRHREGREPEPRGPHAAV
jgi:energy-coupling factor transporter ATP-binding protein EcfA2